MAVRRKNTKREAAASPNPEAAKAMDLLRAMAKKHTGEEAIGIQNSSLPCVSSGSTCIDDMIGGVLAPDGSGPRCAGYPRRQITEVYGDYSSGKTTAALQAIAECQRAGGRAMFLDYEHALDQVYARKIGVSFDEDKLAVFDPTTLEDGFKLIKIGLATGLDLIVVDSVAAMVPKSEFEESRKIEDRAQIGIVAMKFSQILPKLNTWLAAGKGRKDEKTGRFTLFSTNPQGTAILLLNQVRSKVSTGGWGGKGGSSDHSTGGNALKFYTYLRLKFTKIKAESVKKRDPLTGKSRTYPYGNHTQVKLVKSKVDGKQGFTTDIFIRFNYGIDDYYSLIEAAVSHKIVSKSGAQYKLGDQSFRGRENLRKYLVENDKVFGNLRDKVLASVRAGDVDITDEELSDDGVEIVSDIDMSDLDGNDPEVEEVEFDEEESEEEAE
jgi:recombination protein RecA